MEMQDKPSIDECDIQVPDETSKEKNRN